ncbi:MULTISPECIES: hypothetical protein [Thiorhodovibrio]|nr:MULTISPECIES: hypothetical protein [Thiorhodovibrio]WPL11281.1 hypothetical protein Thiosp_01013 [Thiorhodovibrio litoralis]
MLAPLALVALLIGGSQAVLIVSEDDAAVNDHPQVAQVETAKSPFEAN